MTIEIRQLLIRAVVDGHTREAHDNRSERVASAAAPAPRVEPGPRPGLSADERQRIVGACVREVLRRLERVGER